MEEEDGDASTPFWLQSRRNNTHFRRTSSLGGSATTVAIQAFFAGAAVILIVFFIITPFFSSVSQFLRPQLVRKSWDYLNFVLVLFAVICGFFSRNTSDDESDHNKEHLSKNNDVINGYSFDKFSKGGDQFPEQTVYKRHNSLRSSSSYPDLRLRDFESDERWRFYDDTRVSQCRYDASDSESGNGGKKVHSCGSDVTAPYYNPRPPPSAPPYPLSPPPSPPRAPPASKPAKRRTKKVYQDVVAKEENKERSDFVAATLPVTPVPPPATVYQKKGGATKDFLITLRREKKKKQRQQSIDGLDLLFGSDSQFESLPPPPPPPPPPFFSSKKGKSKKTNSNPPPPPPPPYWSFESRASMAKSKFIGTGSESPLMPIPLPPPPPPPFKMPAWKFVKRGDYVRMASNISISSDELDDDSDVAQSSSGRRMFCPSPDVDTKADDFIARFRAGLKLEKMNSVKRRRSNLGPEPGPDESES
ncbi:unnamed protein product [Eruca vesicaria subsp. sativa]|uniref:Hydroxyproline-rich glycoprotein family protein n=1 Tax=Eruca vesicaria subsp. sativa TaxID=29727 RepID=A0ABC8KU92_ERUVS|nr:unnamed protein product [Eruca vesicaria subsp. sativa]